jgi:hypothetical protein
MKSAKRFTLLRLVERERERERRRGGDAQGWWGNGEVEKRIISEEGKGVGVGVGKKVYKVGAEENGTQVLTVERR